MLNSPPLASTPSSTEPGSSSITCAATAVTRSGSVRLESISGAANGLKVAREARIALDLPAQTRHLDIDVAHVPAELRRLGQLLARDRLPGLLRQAGEQRCLGCGQMNDFATAEQLAANNVEAAAAEADL